MTCLISVAGLLLKAWLFPTLPEQLMRSRYTAYTLHDIDYIMATQQGDAAKHFDRASARAWSRRVAWQGLVVHQTSPLVLAAKHATVHFTAYYEDGGHVHAMEENSIFMYASGRWWYTGKRP